MSVFTGEVVAAWSGVRPLTDAESDPNQNLINEPLKPLRPGHFPPQPPPGAQGKYWKLRDGNMKPEQQIDDPTIRVS
jgi:hypothetical protein